VQGHSSISVEKRDENESPMLKDHVFVFHLCYMWLGFSFLSRGKKPKHTKKEGRKYTENNEGAYEKPC